MPSCWAASAIRSSQVTTLQITTDELCGCAVYRVERTKFRRFEGSGQMQDAIGDPHDLDAAQHRLSARDGLGSERHRGPGNFSASQCARDSRLVSLE